MPQIVGSDVTSLRHVNRAGALRCLRRTPDAFLTATTVAQDLELSRPTAARLLTELVESGWAELKLAHTGSAGRPARTFRLQRRHGLVAAIDLGVNNLLVVTADLAGDVVRRSYTPHRHPDSAEAMAEITAAALRQALTEQAAGDAPGYGDLLAVSVSVPATVGRDGALRPWVDSPAWADDELAAALLSRFRADGHPVPELHGSPAAALRAELSRGTLREHEDGVFVLAGDVTGVAPLLDGAPYLGAHGGAGAISGLPGVDWRGATAQVLAATGTTTLDELVAQGLAGHDDAVAALARYARDLAPGLEVLARSFDPAVMVLGGCLAPAGELVLASLRETMAQVLGETAPRLRCAEVDHVDAPALGGLSAALDAVDWGA